MIELLSSELIPARLFGWLGEVGLQISARSERRKSALQKLSGLGGKAPSTHPPTSTAGYYMFIETSRPRELGDRARLVSPLYNASAKFYCVSFFYHMYGKHIGELETREI